MTPKKYLILLAITLCSTVGDFFLKKGMNQAGNISMENPFLLLHALTNPWIVFGVLILIGFFASYVSALSWADLTYVMPATAFGYVLTAFSSALFLHEHVSISRWTGVFLISLAVGFVTGGPAKTVQPGESPLEQP
jgi:drug/metabolite transporter (DMT)-like permease